MHTYKTKKMIFIITSIIAACALAFALLKTVYVKRPGLECSCSTIITHENGKTGVKMNATVHFTFRNDGKGIITLDGEIIDGSNNYQLSRTISMDYEYFGQNLYFIKQKKEAINIRDSLPEGMFEKRFFSSNYFYISKVKDLNNVILIASRVTPISLCVIN